MSSNNKIKMGKFASEWKGGIAKSITFCVTEQCNLACKYCYMIGKNSANKLSFDTAKKAIDYIFSNRQIFNEESVVWDFIGGEPFLEIDLIDKICDYIKYKMYNEEHPWFNNYRFNFSTNGLLYNDPKVQNFINKNKTHVCISISIDGNKIKHDLQRIKLDGTGSYEHVIKNVPLWLEQFPDASTKATFSHEDLVHVKDSIISLWNNGIKDVAANVVFEDVWHEGDDLIFETQLKELADYVIENKLWNDYSVRFFDPKIGFPLAEEDLNRNFCGAGKMLAIDCNGRYFPCIRFLDFTLCNKTGISIGDVNSGINFDKLRPFYTLTAKNLSEDQCIKCDVASGCSWCTGFNYDSSHTDTIYERATFICKMHKANVRANKYFWDKFSKVTGTISPRQEYANYLLESRSDTSTKSNIKKYLQFITADNIVPHCSYKSLKNTHRKMSDEILKKGLEFAKVNNFIPVFIGQTNTHYDNCIKIIDNNSIDVDENSVIIYDSNEIITNYINSDNCILKISKNNINEISNLVTKIHDFSNRINIIIEDIEEWENDDVMSYKGQLEIIAELIINTYKEDKPIEVNVLTDIINLKSMCNCGAGEDTFTLAPNGKIYICAAFYFDNPDNSIGTIEEGIFIKNKHLLELKNAPICSICDAKHCKRCKYLNKKLTNEINTPSKIQCIVSHIERNVARELQNRLHKDGVKYYKKLIPELSYLDPLEKILNNSSTNCDN